jgi:hypothetical protein
LKGQIVRNNETLAMTKKIKVRAGQETRVSLEFADAKVARR